jgi:hypothetical protein
VLDRARLERIAGNFYGFPEREYRRLCKFRSTKYLAGISEARSEWPRAGVRHRPDRANVAADNDAKICLPNLHQESSRHR